MTHTPDHRDAIKSAVMEWLREDVHFPGKTILLSFLTPLVEKLVKVVEKAKQDDKKA